MGSERRRCELLANELREVASELTGRLRAESTGDLSMSQTSVLARLHKAGPSTVAELARAEHVKPQSMGVTVASLEEEGLVTRRIDPNDGRRLNASLTEAGKEALLAGRAARQAWLSKALEDRLDDAEQRDLLKAMSLVKKVLGR
jgi:DNA-binding MarR family transcriptional regulator